MISVPPRGTNEDSPPTSVAGERAIHNKSGFAGRLNRGLLGTSIRPMYIRQCFDTLRFAMRWPAATRKRTVCSCLPPVNWRAILSRPARRDWF